MGRVKLVVQSLAATTAEACLEGRGELQRNFILRPRRHSLFSDKVRYNQHGYVCGSHVALKCSELFKAL